mgnify:CR=1 FL=1
MSVYKNIKGKKGLLVWGIILFVVFMGLGLLIYSGEVDAKYEVLTKDTSENTYAKLNVSLLDSAFATETLDGKEKDYYVAFDEDDNPFIIVLDKDGLENLRKIQEYTLSEIEMDKPNPVTVYGNVSKSDTEVFKYLQEFLKDEDGNTYTIDELKSVVGEIYLDTTWDNVEQGIWALITFSILSLSGLILIIVYVVRNKKSKSLLDEYGKELEKIEEDVNSGRGIHNKECGVYLTDRYLLSYANGVKLIELMNIVWIYSFITKQNGITTSKSIYVVTNDGKSNVIAVVNTWGKKNKASFEELYQDIINKVPNVLVGYSKENKERAKEMYKK